MAFPSETRGSKPDALRLSPTQHQGNELPRRWPGLDSVTQPPDLSRSGAAPPARRGSAPPPRRTEARAKRTLDPARTRNPLAGVWGMLFPPAPLPPGEGPLEGRRRRSFRGVWRCDLGGVKQGFGRGVSLYLILKG